MKLTVLTWLRDSSVALVGRTIEIFFRVILLISPLALFLILIQLRNKASKVSSLSVYTTDDSTWQHVFPGFILVAINPNVMKNRWNELKRDFQTWIFQNRFLLLFLAFLAIVILITFGIFIYLWR